jgi:hypothetical protein
MLRVSECLKLSNVLLGPRASLRPQSVRNLSEELALIRETLGCKPRFYSHALQLREVHVRSDVLLAWMGQRIGSDRVA